MVTVPEFALLKASLARQQDQIVCFEVVINQLAEMHATLRHEQLTQWACLKDIGAVLMEGGGALAPELVLGESQEQNTNMDKIVATGICDVAAGDGYVKIDGKVPCNVGMRDSNNSREGATFFDMVAKDDIIGSTVLVQAQSLLETSPVAVGSPGDANDIDGRALVCNTTAKDHEIETGGDVLCNIGTEKASNFDGWAKFFGAVAQADAAVQAQLSPDIQIHENGQAAFDPSRVPVETATPTALVQPPAEETASSMKSFEGESKSVVQEEQLVQEAHGPTAEPISAPVVLTPAPRLLSSALHQAKLLRPR